MAIKKYKPTTPSRRYLTTSSFEGVNKNAKPVRSLTTGAIKKTAGRNANGRISVRHIGGGAKRKYRIIDFKRNKDGVKAKVADINYDPNRSAFIALLHYVDGTKSYILAPKGLNIGDYIESGDNAEISVGNNKRLNDIPVGTVVHNVEMQPNRGGQIARSAGNSARLTAKEGNHATLKMPSGEIRKVHINCRATIGRVGNVEHELITYGKAGRKRHMGVRPTVRGVVMNPNDHPHGGGEGKTPVNRKAPVSPWGQKAIGKKTRKKRKNSSNFIIKRKKSK